MKLTIKQKGKEVAFAKITSSFGGYIELEKLFVEKEYRNQGLAKKLLGKIVLLSTWDEEYLSGTSPRITPKLEIK